MCVYLCLYLYQWGKPDHNKAMYGSFQFVMHESCLNVHTVCTRYVHVCFCVCIIVLYVLAFDVSVACITTPANWLEKSPLDLSLCSQISRVERPLVLEHTLTFVSVFPFSALPFFPVHFPLNRSYYLRVGARRFYTSQQSALVSRLSLDGDNV